MGVFPRPAHRAMEGKFIKWSQPPTLDGMTGHAGEFPNCRCHPEPVIPRTDGTQRAFFKGLPTQEEEKKEGVQLPKSHWEKTAATPQVPHLPGEPLYNVGRARFEPRKLTEYSLNPFALDKNGEPNNDARAKAPYWEKMLGFTASDAGEIEAQIMRQVRDLPAAPKGEIDKYGQRFTVYVPVKGKNGKTVDVRTGWIYDRTPENGKMISTIPRLINCFIDGKIDENGHYKG